MCVWKWFSHFYVFDVYCYFLVYLVLYVCIYGVRGGMHDTELGYRGRGDKLFCWAGQSGDVEPGGQEQGQGRTAF